MYNSCALLSSLGRELSYRLNIMSYESSKHYNLILNLKAAADSHGGYCAACNVGFRNDRGHRHKKMPTLLCHPVLQAPRH